MTRSRAAQPCATCTRRATNAKLSACGGGGGAARGRVGTFPEGMDVRKRLAHRGAQLLRLPLQGVQRDRHGDELRRHLVVGPRRPDDARDASDGRASLGSRRATRARATWRPRCWRTPRSRRTSSSSTRTRRASRPTSSSRSSTPSRRASRRSASRREDNVWLVMDRASASSVALGSPRRVGHRAVPRHLLRAVRRATTCTPLWLGAIKDGCGGSTSRWRADERSRPRAVQHRLGLRRRRNCGGWQRHAMATLMGLRKGALLPLAAAGDACLRAGANVGALAAGHLRDHQSRCRRCNLRQALASAAHYCALLLTAGRTRRGDGARRRDAQRRTPSRRPRRPRRVRRGERLPSLRAADAGLKRGL